MKVYPFIAGMVVVLASLAPNGAGLHQPPAVSPGQAGRAPNVSPEFQAEVSQLAAAGLRLKEAVEAGLDGAAHHLAAIFQREKPKAPNEAYELRILEGDGRAAKTIFRRADFFFYLR